MRQKTRFNKLCTCKVVSKLWQVVDFLTLSFPQSIKLITTIDIIKIEESPSYKDIPSAMKKWPLLRRTINYFTVLAHLKSVLMRWWPLPLVVVDL
jgi:hypothetical protein